MSTPTWMGGDPEAGETYVQGKDRATARMLLDAAAAVGADPLLVRTVTGGFIVPDAVWDEAQVQQQGQQDTDPDPHGF